MKKTLLLAFVMAVSISCFGVKTLPVLQAPFVEELSFLKEVVVKEGKLEKREMKEPLLQPVLLLKLRNIEGKAHMELKVYRSKKLIKTYFFSFGEKNKYYSEVIIWKKLKCIDKEGEYLVAVFLNGQLLLFKSYFIHRK